MATALLGVPKKVPRVTGPRALYYWARFLVDPVGGMRALYRRHGRLVFIGNILPMVNIDKPTYLAVGQIGRAHV